jgi:hypothetical protein
MSRTLNALVAGAMICAVGLLAAVAQEPRKGEKPQIPGGIEGHVKSVDHEKETLSITTSDGRERTFTITEETTMLGPRGGKVRSRLKDRRFHEGMEVTVVAAGATAKEVHLGYDRSAQGQPTGSSKPMAKRTAKAATEGGEAPKPKPAGSARGETAKAATAATKGAAQEGEADEDDEFPGKITSFDSSRRVLVVSLLNGQSRSFLLSRDVRVLVRGTLSSQGLNDPALKAGTAVSVHVEAGSRRVRELRVAPPPAPRAKKAA